MEWIVVAALAFFAWRLMRSRNRKRTAVAVEPTPTKVTLARLPPAPRHPIVEADEQPEKRSLKMPASARHAVETSANPPSRPPLWGKLPPGEINDKADLDTWMKPYREVRTRSRRLIRRAEKAAKPASLIAELDTAITEACTMAFFVDQIEQKTFLKSEAATNRFFDEVEDFGFLTDELKDARNSVIEALYLQLESEGVVEMSENISDEEIERVVFEHFLKSNTI
jgi:hypothetical protein